MAGEGEASVPQSPETQAPEVREDLQQNQVSHEGVARSPEGIEPGSSTHQGAVEEEVTPVSPPMRGPSDLVSDQEDGDDILDPVDEITPG